MAIIVIASAFPVAEHRGEVIAAFEAAMEKVHAEEDGCELYALHEGPDGRVLTPHPAGSPAKGAL